MDAVPLYRQLADHYRQAIRAGALAPGQRMPSVRELTRRHNVSLSTTLQACRQLEDEGWLQARPRSGFFVRHPSRAGLRAPDEPPVDAAPAFEPDPSPYAGMNDRVSDFVARSERASPPFDFGSAYACPEAYPLDALRACIRRALHEDASVIVQPAPAQGDPLLRAALARRALARGLAHGPDDIVVTNGASEAINLALRAVAQPGDLVAVDSPTHYILLQQIESLGMRALEIPASASAGMSIEALDMALRMRPGVRAVVTVPSFQNPLGAVMPDANKQRLVELCAERGVVLIEDDIYAELGEGPGPPRAAKAWDAAGGVIHCSSLHKTVAPGMRLGWMLGGRWLERIVMLKHAHSRNNDALTQRAVARFVASAGYDRHLARLRERLRRWREDAADTIAASFPEGTRLHVPSGGMLLWVELPQRRSASVVFQRALAEGIRIVPGSLFSNTDRYDHFMRITCGRPCDPDVVRALRRLGEIVRSVPPAAC